MTSRTWIGAIIAFTAACSNEPDRKPANAPLAPEARDVLLDAGDVTTLTNDHEPGAVVGRGGATGTGAGATAGGSRGVIPTLDAGAARNGAVAPERGGTTPPK